MKKIIILLLLIGMLSCVERKPITESITNPNLTSEQIDSILLDFQFEYASPIILDSTDQVLIPISTESSKKRTSYKYDSSEYPRYWNVLFYNRKTEETRLLTEEKVRISKIYTSKSKEHDRNSKLMREKILYEMGNIDFNQDKKLNYEDPENLFSSNIDGTNLKRISPPNEYLQYFKIIPNSRQILMRTRRDINQDLKFNGLDESVWYKAEFIDEEWKLNEIIDETGRKKIEHLYFEQWLRKK